MEPTFSEFTVIFTVATVVILMMSGGIVMFALYYQKKMLTEQLKRQALEVEYQQKMLLAALSSQEGERRRLAGDLHDSVGALLSAVRMGLATLVRKNEIKQESVADVSEMIDETISTVRSISRDLMPSTLEKFGLTQAVSELCERFTATSRLPIRFNETGDKTKLPGDSEIMAFRIVQELLNNAIKHAQAQNIHVNFQWKDKALVIDVEDDGRGFDFDKIKGSKESTVGLGLFNMENRAKMLGGKLCFEKERAKGTHANLTIPVNHA